MNQNIPKYKQKLYRDMFPYMFNVLLTHNNGVSFDTDLFF